MKTYKSIKEQFNEDIDNLQKECKHSISRLKIHRDHSVIGCGSLLSRIDITCDICDITWIIWQGDNKITNKTALKIWNKMSKIGSNSSGVDGSNKRFFSFPDTGIIPKRTKEKEDEMRLPYKRYRYN